MELGSEKSICASFLFVFFEQQRQSLYQKARARTRVRIQVLIGLYVIWEKEEKKMGYQNTVVSALAHATLAHGPS